MSSTSAHSVRSPAPAVDMSPLVDAVAGATGALLALLSTYPLMTLNTRQHTEGRKKSESNATGSATRKKPGMVDELRTVIQEDGGVTSLYRGIEPAVVGTVTSQLVYNYWYAVFKNARVKRTGTQPGAMESLLIASLAGSINVVCTIPIWTVCVRMQAERNNTGNGNDASGKGEEFSGEGGDDDGGDGDDENTLARKLSAKIRAMFTWDNSSSGEKREDTREDNQHDGGEITHRHGASAKPKPKKKTFAETTRAVYAESGVRGFWRGLGPSLVMVSNPALQWAFYETVCAGFRKRRVGVVGRGPGKKRSSRVQSHTGELTFWEVLIAASLAKMGATTITYPVLLVKTRLQAGTGDSAVSTFSALKQIVADEGPNAFYRGMGTKMTQTVFAAALMFVTKEEISKRVRSAVGTRRNNL